MYPIQTIIHTELANPTTMDSIIAQNRARRRTPPLSASFMPLIAEAITIVRRSPAQQNVMPMLTMPGAVTASVPTALMTNGWAVIWARANPNPPSATIRARP